MLDRRTFLLSSGLAGAAMTAGTTAAAATPGGSAGRFDRPQAGFAPAGTTLRRARPSAIGLDEATIAGALRTVHDYAEPQQGRAMFPGAVTLLAGQGTVFAHEATGWALRYADREGTELPAAERIKMRTDTIFDMASVSKLFTTLVALGLLEQGRLHLDRPVAEQLPGYGANGKQAITPKMLLTHTAGLPADPKPSLWEGYPDVAARKRAILDSPVQSEPGKTYRYSDLSMLSLQLLIEHLTGTGLDEQVRSRIIEPLGLTDTGYNPHPGKRQRIAPTEYEVGSGSSHRGLVWGEVHDENAWSLGGVAGHAGVFSTARDMAVLAQALLGGGSYGGTRILGEATAELIFTDFNGRFPEDSHGLGFELDQMFYMGALASKHTAGHTGFTGTSLVIDRLSRSIVLLLTNRVHPNRDWGGNNPAREAVATGVARAMRVPAPTGKDYWAGTIGDQRTATLTTETFATGRRAATLRFEAFIDTESSDVLVVETCTDGESWQPRKLRASGKGAPDGPVESLSGHGHRAWWRVHVDLPEAASAPRMRVRWRYRTDKQYTGRGVGVDGARVLAGGRVLLDLERDPAAATGEAWHRTRG